MTVITKILLAILAGIVLLWIGGGTPTEAQCQFDCDVVNPTTSSTTTLVPPPPPPPGCMYDCDVVNSTTTSTGVDVCHLNGSVEIIPEGDFQFYESWNDERAVGSHSISGMPCGYIEPAVTSPPSALYPPTPPEGTVTPPSSAPPPSTVAPPTTERLSQPELQSTGSETPLWIAALGSTALMAGFAISRVARR